MNTEEIPSCHLLMEVGDAGVSLLWMNQSRNEVMGVVVHVFDEEGNQEEQLKQVFQSKGIFDATPSSVTVTYNYRESLCVPSKLFKDHLKASMLSLVYGENPDSGVIVSDDTQSELKLVYRMPAGIPEILESHFSGMKVTSSGLVWLGNHEPQTRLTAIIFYDTVKLILHIKGQLQFMSQHHYETPDDVLYFLLNACQQHDVKPDEILLNLYGMIVEDSALYQHLYNYFLHVRFAGLNDNISLRSEIESLPAHFFSHLIEIALCES